MIHISICLNFSAPTLSSVGTYVITVEQQQPQETEGKMKDELEVIDTNRTKNTVHLVNVYEEDERKTNTASSDFTQLAALLVIFIVLWCICFTFASEMFMPSTALMRMAFLFLGAQISGILITYIHLPDMLGMLFFGVLYTNIGFGNFRDVQPLESFLR